jgi:hypothetical protein
MDLGINLAAPNYWSQSQFGDIVLCGSAVLAPKLGAKGAIGPSGWPVGADNYQQNVSLGDVPTDYVFIVLKGAVSLVDINQGANNGGHIRVSPHVGTGLGVASATFTAKGSGFIVATVTDPGETRWAIVAAADIERWKADPYCFSSTWIARFAGFRFARFMDWLLTNTNMGGGYVDPDPTRPGAFVQGVPLSIAVKYAKQTGISPWLPLPVASNDDGVRSFAQRIDAARAAGLKLVVELGNEVWNGAFKAHKYAVDQEAALIAAGKLPPVKTPDGNRWYGYRSAQVSKILQSMGWKVGVDFDMAIGCFPNGPQLAPLVLAGIAAAGGTDRDFSGWMTTFYTHGDVTGDFDKTVAMVKAGDAGVATAFDTILHGKVSSVDWLGTVNLPLHAAFAKAHGWKLLAYEGNMSFFAIPFFADSALVKQNAGITKADVVAFFGKLSAHPRSGEVMTAVLKVLQANGVEIACAYADQGGGGENGFWGLYGTPAWDALVAWIAANQVEIPQSLHDEIAAILAQIDDVRAKVAALA